MGAVILAVGLAGIAGLLDQLVDGGLEPRQRLVHFLLVGGALQHLLRIGERGGESIPTRQVISLVIALHLIDKRLQLGLVKGTLSGNVWLSRLQGTHDRLQLLGCGIDILLQSCVIVQNCTGRTKGRFQQLPRSRLIVRCLQSLCLGNQIA